MNLIQTALLALPAAVTGFLGALSFSSDSGSELKIAALAGQTEFLAFTDKQILANWKSEMDKRRDEQTRSRGQKAINEAITQKLRNIKPNLPNLTKELHNLGIDASKQKAVNSLNVLNWQKNVITLVEEINGFPNQINRDMEGLETKLKKLGLEQQRTEVQNLANSIRNALTVLKNNKPKWEKQIEGFLDDYKKITNSPTSMK